MPTTSSVSGRAPPDLAPAVRARLGELVARHGAPGGADACLARLLELLAADPHAPTAVRDPARAVESHIADSLAGLELAAVRAARTLADVGSGAGFPGLPLACSLPHARIALVESAGRKASYLTRTARALGRDNVEVVARRAEQWREGRGSQDAVLARALAPLGVILEYAAPLLRDGGVAVAWGGPRPSQNLCLRVWPANRGRRPTAIQLDGRAHGVRPRTAPRRTPPTRGFPRARPTVPDASVRADDHRVCDRQSEGRRGQDDHGGQHGGVHRRGRLPDPAGGRRPAGQRHRRTGLSPRLQPRPV